MICPNAPAGEHISKRVQSQCSICGHTAGDFKRDGRPQAFAPAVLLRLPHLADPERVLTVADMMRDEIRLDSELALDEWNDLPWVVRLARPKPLTAPVPA